MRTPAVPVENVAEIIWGALLIIYLAGAGRPEYRTWPVVLVFGLSAAAALLELWLRRRGWPGVQLYDSIVWTICLSAMVAVTGGRSSEAWPAYIMMSLTAPSLGRPVLHYGLMGLNAAVYVGVCLTVNPAGAPLVPTLLLLRIGLFFLVTYVVDRLMFQAAEASRSRVGELVSARDAERRRLALEIHDWLGTGIVSPLRKLELALRSPDSATLSARAEETIAALRRSHEEMRRIMEQLHPHLLEQMGLTDALKAQAAAWGEQHNITTAFEGDTAPPPPPDVALAAYRILQEALNNVAQHAQARSVRIILRLRSGALTLSICDDGVGFPGSRRPGGRGVQGMRERVQAFGGDLRIDSRPGRGTTVTAALPIMPK